MAKKRYLDYEGLKKVQERIDAIYARKGTTSLDSTITNINSNIKTIQTNVIDLQNNVDKLKGIDGSIFKIDTELSQASKTDGKIHLIPTGDTEAGDTRDTYNEYVYITDHWEIIGTRRVSSDIAEYLKKADADNLYASKSDTESKITELEERVTTLENNSGPSTEEWKRVTEEQIDAMF